MLAEKELLEVDRDDTEGGREDIDDAKEGLRWRPGRVVPFTEGY